MSHDDPLAEALARGSVGEAQHIASFLELLLESTVLVPLAPPSRDSTTEERLLELRGEVGRVIPLFSSLDSLAQWSAAPVPTTTKEFRALLWLVDDECWLHLNPGCEIGKEFSPWEIALLRKGKEAIAEIVEELTGENSGALAIMSDSSRYDFVKHKLTIIMESYPQVQEAFLTAAATDPGGEHALIGLRSTGLSEDKTGQLVSEIEQLFIAADLPAPAIVTDLNAEADRQHILFGETVPFYIAQQQFPSSSLSLRGSRGVVHNVLASLKRLVHRRR